MREKEVQREREENQDLRSQAPEESLYVFPTAIVTNYHKYSSLIQHKILPFTEK